jgi:two-component system chemotaxis family response regulator WspR
VTTTAVSEGSAVVLLVDDQAIVWEAVRRMLEGEPGLTLHYCSEAAQALRKARELRPTVILQDLVMPDVDGFSLLKFYRADPATAGVPVIVLSTKEDPRDKSRAFAEGASDYLVKLPDKVELVARLRAHSRAHLLQLERDEAYSKLEALKVQLELSNEELARLSMVDGLTGLANRRAFDEALDREWRRAARENSELALVLVDIDFFKRYNDSYGHPAGDECLRQVARALAHGARRPADVAARYGGEEFAILLPSTGLSGALIVAEGLRAGVAALNLEHRASEAASHVTLSLGAACVRASPSASPDGLVSAADGALYQAKHEGRNRVAVATAAQ